MKLIQYIGSRTSKTDNVAGTGLTWTQEQVHPVSDDAAKKLLGFPAVWREVAEPVAAPEPAPVDAEAQPWMRAPARTRALKRVS